MLCREQSLQCVSSLEAKMPKQASKGMAEIHLWNSYKIAEIFRIYMGFLIFLQKKTFKSCNLNFLKMSLFSFWKTSPVKITLI
jgi:hypothetical protein